MTVLSLLIYNDGYSLVIFSNRDNSSVFGDEIAILSISIRTFSDTQ